MLFGRVVEQDAPRVAQFEEMVRHDEVLPCWAKAALPRLARVAYSEKLRQLVWKRMCSEELYFLDRKALARIESIADACDMPLHRSRG